MSTVKCVKIGQRDLTVSVNKDGVADYAAALLSGLVVTTKAEYARDVIARALALQHSAQCGS